MNEAVVSRFPIYNPRPTLRIDEQEFDRIRELVIGMDVREQEGGLTSMELRLRNMASDRDGTADFAFENEEDVQLGSTIALYSGDLSEPQEIFRGVVTGIESEFKGDSPPEIVLYAEDTLQQFRMKRRTKLYEDQSIADIANTMASDHGIRATITALTDPVGNWTQMNESDLAFLRRLACRYDADIQIVGEELQVSPRQDVERGSIGLELHSQLRSVKFFADLSQQVTGVSVTGWNPETGRRVKAESTGRNFGPGQGRSGSDLLSEKLGERNEHVGHIAVKADAEATALADAVFDQHARKFVTVQGVTEGNAQLRVGTHVNISGVSARFENTYYVTAAQHIYDQDKGYETHFCAESYTLGNP